MPHPGDDYPDFTENAQGGLIKGFLLIQRASSTNLISAEAGIP
jgi:hypothetical protein